MLASLIAVAVASADNLITQDLITDGNSTAARLATGTAEIFVQQTGGACDANGDRINVTSNQPWLTIESPGFVNVTGCGTANEQALDYTVALTAPLGGVARVTGSENVDDPQISTGPNSDFDVTVVPRPPANLASPSKTTTSIDLSWDVSPDDGDVTNYQLERASTSGGPWSTINNPAKGASSFTNSGLTANTQYCYRLAARFQAGGSVGTLLSDFAGPLCVTTNAANTPPVVVVTGVAHGGSYEAGAVPAAGCSVTDAQDGNSTFAATLSAITGPLAAFGLGSQTASCSHSDAGGLSATASSTYSIVDTTDPGVAFVGRTPAANDHGWNNADVVLQWACTDTGSGVVAATVSKTVSTEGANQSATGTCEDRAGNDASDTQNGINIDKTKPTASASASPAPNANGWNNTNVTVSFSGSDLGGSGIDACDAAVVLSDDGAGQSASGDCTDKAGNVSAPATASGINIDKTSPTLSISAVLSGTSTSYSSGAWTNQDVDVSFHCADTGGSGIDASSVHPNETVSASASYSETCKDVAGNTSDVASFGVKIDKTPPTLSISAVLSGTSTSYSSGAWTNQDVDVSFHCADTGGSGIDASSVPPNETVSASKSYSETCKDVAGNTSDLASFEVKIDKVPPTLSASAVKGTGPGFAGATSYVEDSWTNQDVKVTFDCSDNGGGSGVASGSPNPASQTFTAQGTHTAGSDCSDVAGNSTSASFGVKIDKTPPTITAAATVAGGGAYTSGPWTNKTVTVSFTCSDTGGSGIAGTCPVDVVVSTDTALAGQSVSANVSDNAGNSAASNVINVKVDKTAPIVNVTGVSTGASYTIGSVPVPGCSTSDPLSNVKTSATLQPLTGSGTTSPNGVGSFTATCSGAEDNAGNAGSATATYSVVYGSLVRFLQPINNTGHDLANSPDVSTFKAGSTVPVKFQVKLPNGTIVLPTSAAWVTPQKGGSTGQPVDEALYTDPATSGSSYVLNGDHHQYNWKTDKSAAGFYWLFGAMLDDGQTYKVYISLR